MDLEKLDMMDDIAQICVFFKNIFVYIQSQMEPVTTSGRDQVLRTSTFVKDNQEREVQEDVVGESDGSRPKICIFVACLHSLHTEISNDLTCDTIISRNVLAKLDKKYLSNQTF